VWILNFAFCSGVRRIAPDAGTMLFPRGDDNRIETQGRPRLRSGQVLDSARDNT